MASAKQLALQKVDNTDKLFFVYAKKQLVMAYPLSNLQLELLKLFSREVPDEDVRQIKRLITQYFAHKAIQEANQVWDREGWDEQKVEELLNTHARTPYLKKTNRT